MGHVNLKNNTPRMHTILRWKIHKFSAKGHSPSPDRTPLAAYGASILASSALYLRPPMFQWRWRPWRVIYVRGHISEIWRPKFSEFAPDRQPNNTPSHNFCRPDAVPDAQRTVSKHWRQIALKANAPKFMLLTIILIIVSFLSPSQSPFHA